MESNVPRDSAFRKFTKSYSEYCADLRSYAIDMREIARRNVIQFVGEHQKEIAPYLYGVYLIQIEQHQNEGRDASDEIAALETWRSALPGGVEIEVNENSFIVKYPDEQIEKASEAAEARYRQLTRYPQLLSRSILSSLIARTELLCAQLMRTYYEINGQEVTSSDKVFSLDDLQEFSSVDEARKYLWEKRISDALRGSLDTWITELKKIFRIQCGYLDDLLDDLREIAQRRNLIAHNGGVVNSLYIRNLSKTKFDGKAELGQRLGVSAKYLANAINVFDRAFTLVGADIWARQGADAEEVADLIQVIAYNHMKSERWSVAEGLSRFVMGDSRLPADSKLIAQFNYWQCLKWADRFSAIKSAVEEFDASALDPKFRLAKCALLSDRGAFFEALGPAVVGGSISLSDAIEWPVFREMRTDPQFGQVIDSLPKKAQESKEKKASNAEVTILEETSASNRDGDQPAMNGTQSESRPSDRL